MDKKIINAEYKLLDVINIYTKEGYITTSQAIDLKSKVHSISHKLLAIDKEYDKKHKEELAYA
jgi:hypothetical protein